MCPLKNEYLLQSLSIKRDGAPNYLLITIEMYYDIDGLISRIFREG